MSGRSKQVSVSGGGSYLCSCISLWVPSPQLNRYLQQRAALTCVPGTITCSLPTC